MSPTVSVRREPGDIVIVEVLDCVHFGGAIIGLQDELIEALGDGNMRVVFDLRQLRYLCDGMVRALVRAYAHSKKNGVDLAVVGVRGRVLELFQLLQLDHIFELYDDEAAAILSLRGRN